MAPYLGETFDANELIAAGSRSGSKSDARLASQAADSIGDRSLKNLEIASGLARAGFNVFPTDQSKKPLVKWRSESTFDLARINEWWSRYHNALVGLDLGRSDLVVIDCDRHGGPDGVDAFERLIAAHGLPEGVPVVVTANGGRHYYFSQPPGERLGNGKGALPPGVDVRGDGGYTVAPRSIISDERGWRPMDGAPDLADAYNEAKIPPVPQWIVELIQTRPGLSDPTPKNAPPPKFESSAGERERTWAARALEGVAADLSAMAEGGRNNALNGAAYRMGRMIARGWIGESEVRSALEDACRQNGLWKSDGARGVRKSMDSGLAAGKAKPHEDLPGREGDDELERLGGEVAAAFERWFYGAGDAAFDPETGEVFGQRQTDCDSSARSQGAAEQKSRSNDGAQGSNRVDVEIVVASSFAGKPIPEMKWGVDGLIPADNVTLFYADGGTGKSLVALQLAVAAATGGSWLGLYPKPGKVLFVSAEDEIDELHRRLARFCPSIEALDDLAIIPLAGKDAVLAAPEKGDILKETPLFKKISEIISKHRPEWLILDTLADLFGGDEIKKTQARQFISLLRGLALKYSVTILLLAHPSQYGKDSGEGTSGNTAWSNSVRSRLYLDRRTRREGSEVIEDDPDLRTLKLMKSNRTAIGTEVIIRYCNGEFIREQVTDTQAQNRAGNAEDVFLKLLNQYEGEGRSVSDKPSANYAPTVFARHAGAAGMSKALLRKAMDSLFEAGRICIEESGPPSRRTRKIAVVAEARPLHDEAQDD